MFAVGVELWTSQTIELKTALDHPRQYIDKVSEFGTSQPIVLGQLPTFDVSGVGVYKIWVPQAFKQLYL